MFKKILIANRGEIALRIQRACREMGIKSVIVYSEADREAKYVKLADEAVCIGPAASAQSYLNMPAIIADRRGHRCRGHPPRLRLPERERRFRRAGREERLRLHRPDAGVDPHHGRQGRGQAGHDQERACPACPAARARCPTTPKEIIRQARAHRLPGDHQGRRRRRRPRHARRAHRSGACCTPCRPRAPRPARPSATRRSTWRSSSRTRATSRSRSWPTTSATRSGWASATARCSAGTRRSSRKRRRRASRGASSSASATAARPPARRSATAAPAPSSSCTRTASSSSSR